MSRPFGEASVVEENFAVFVDTTNTEEKWREWAKQDILVKVKTDSTNAKNDGLLQIERCTAHDDAPIGVLRAIDGDSKTFSKKLTARVAVQAFRVNSSGANGDLSATELVDSDFGARIKPNSEGKAVIIKTGQGTNYESGGYGRVAGGTVDNLVLCYDWRDNIR